MFVIFFVKGKPWKKYEDDEKGGREEEEEEKEGGEKSWLEIQKPSRLQMKGCTVRGGGQPNHAILQSIFVVYI